MGAVAMAQRYTVAFWNLENLFAPEGYAHREPWIAQRMANDLDGWTQDLFDRKIDQLTAIIAQIGGGSGPAILGVCEVENAYALQQLADKVSASLGRPYAIVHADATRDKRGIDTASLRHHRCEFCRRLAVFALGHAKHGNARYIPSHVPHGLRQWSHHDGEPLAVAQRRRP